MPLIPALHLSLLLLGIASILIVLAPLIPLLFQQDLLNYSVFLHIRFLYCPLVLVASSSILHNFHKGSYVLAPAVPPLISFPLLTYFSVQFPLVPANRAEYLLSKKVDIILANFTVTPARKEVVDFANPYMKVALGVVSKDGSVITDLEQLKGKTLLINKGTTADAYFTKNYPDIKLLKFEQNTETFEALRDGRGDALAHDNTLLFAWAKENPGFTVGVKNLGDQDFIAPAVKKGDVELLNWLNAEIEKLGKQGVLKQAYEKTLQPIYGDAITEGDVVVEYK